MAHVASQGSLDHGGDFAALVCRLYDREWLAVHPGLLHQPELRKIHHLDTWPSKTVLFLHSRSNAADVSLDVSRDSDAPAQVRQERTHSHLVGGCAVCLLLVFAIQAAGLHPPHGTADRAALCERVAAAGLSCL